MFEYTYNLHNYIIFCVSIFNSSIKPNIFQWSTEIETLLHVFREIKMQKLQWNLCAKLQWNL